MDGTGRRRRPRLLLTPPRVRPSPARRQSTRPFDGSYASVLDQFRSAYTVAEDVQTPHQRARAALGIGDTLALLGEYTRAREHWMLASEVWSAIGSADARRSEVRRNNSKQ